MNKVFLIFGLMVTADAYLFASGGNLGRNNDPEDGLTPVLAFPADRLAAEKARQEALAKKEKQGAQAAQETPRGLSQEFVPEGALPAAVIARKKRKDLSQDQEDPFGDIPISVGYVPNGQQTDLRALSFQGYRDHKQAMYEAAILQHRIENKQFEQRNQLKVHRDGAKANRRLLNDSLSTALQGRPLSNRDYLLDANSMGRRAQSLAHSGRSEGLWFPTEEEIRAFLKKLPKCEGFRSKLEDFFPEDPSQELYDAILKSWVDHGDLKDMKKELERYDLDLQKVGRLDLQKKYREAIEGNRGQVREQRESGKAASTSQRPLRRRDLFAVWAANPAREQNAINSSGKVDPFAQRRKEMLAGSALPSVNDVNGELSDEEAMERARALSLGVAENTENRGRDFNRKKLEQCLVRNALKRRSTKSENFAVECQKLEKIKEKLDATVSVISPFKFHESLTAFRVTDLRQVFKSGVMNSKAKKPLK